VLESDYGMRLQASTPRTTNSNKTPIIVRPRLSRASANQTKAVPSIWILSISTGDGEVPFSIAHRGHSKILLSDAGRRELRRPLSPLARLPIPNSRRADSSRIGLTFRGSSFQLSAISSHAFSGNESYLRLTLGAEPFWFPAPW
jgi:hypothetical protein